MISEGGVRLVRVGCVIGDVRVIGEGGVCDW